MADVGVQMPPKPDRGQLILITGLLIAVTMVALVLLLNTAIYTENLASRGTDQSGREAIEYRATVVGGVKGLIDAEHDGGVQDRTTLSSNVRRGISTIDNLTARNYATGATVVRIDQSNMSIHNGTVINQTTERVFESANDDADWTLVTNVRETRSFSMEVDRDSLVSTNESQVEGDDAFNVTIDDGAGEPWHAFVYTNETTPEDDVAIAISSEGDPATEVCSIEEDRVEIDFDERTLDGSPCPELDWTTDSASPYTIKFGSGSATSGTYSITVNGSEVVDANYDDSAPNYVPIIYRVDLPLHYKSPTLTYQTTVQVEPGDPR